MPVITVDQALELLTREVQQKLPADEVVEVYNDVFPETPSTEYEANANVEHLIEQIVAYITGERGQEDIVYLWGLIFPRHRNIWYNEEDDRLYYNEETEALWAE